ncbi:MAG: type I-F CRISPR-associated protein Csy2 [Candidatus Thiodiazotropha sp. (ex Dulcina madagascariensis)]|nr:type I-F CRISPR-associated protein Csy2 [Candidatus Thiodiazotropha sp. (ex Dulcina madagascariensis)]
MNDTAALLLLPRLRVQHANAVSGPLSWGFPSPTAFTGFTHALERRLSAAFEIEFGGVGIVCHRFEPQVFKPAGRGNQVFSLTRNPIIAGWKKYDPKPAALVEEGRAHLEISLLIEVVTELDEAEANERLEQLLIEVYAMRLAGGSILPAHHDGKVWKPQWFEWPEYADGRREKFRQVRRRLLPGFALVEREDLLREHLGELRRQDADADADALDALLDLCRLNIEPVGPNPNNPEQTLWEYRGKPGWLSPIPVGYAALSPPYPPGNVINARDQHHPFRFVESLYSLGQWISPHRLTGLEQLLWRHTADSETGIYRCINQYTDTHRNA